jgi:hypothetical protein
VGFPASSPAIGSTNISAAQGADLLNGLWYINIHSEQFTGGEIRGQVLPEPATAALLCGGMGTLLLRRRRRAIR